MNVSSSLALGVNAEPATQLEDATVTGREPFAALQDLTALPIVTAEMRDHSDQIGGRGDFL
jgi:hypothetical protein